MCDSVDDKENPWSILEQTLSDDVLPAIADQSVIVWGLGKSIGDTLTYVDERGESFKVRLVGGLANSIFQGNMFVVLHLLLCSTFKAVCLMLFSHFGYLLLNTSWTLSLLYASCQQLAYPYLLKSLARETPSLVAIALFQD